MYRSQTNVSAYAAPFYRGLTDDQCRLIHCASLEILERTGVRLHYQPAIDLLKKAGCVVDGNRVRVPTHLVEWALRTAPSRIMIYNRYGEPVMPLGDHILGYFPDELMLGKEALVKSFPQWSQSNGEQIQTVLWVLIARILRRST